MISASWKFKRSETLRKIEISTSKFQFYEGFPQSYDRNFVETLRKIEISMWKFQFFERVSAKLKIQTVGKNPKFWSSFSLYILFFRASPGQGVIWSNMYEGKWLPKLRLQRLTWSLSFGAHFPYTYCSSEPILDKGSFGTICIRKMTSKTKGSETYLKP